MSEAILTNIVVGTFAALFTFFITSIINKSAVVRVVQEVLRQHELLYHSDKMPEFVKKVVDDHKAACAGAQDIKKIKNVVLAIYSQNGGNIAELDV